MGTAMQPPPEPLEPCAYLVWQVVAIILAAAYMLAHTQANPFREDSDNFIALTAGRRVEEKGWLPSPHVVHTTACMPRPS